MVIMVIQLHLEQLGDRRACTRDGRGPRPKYGRQAAGAHVRAPVPGEAIVARKSREVGSGHR